MDKLLLGSSLDYYPQCNDNKVEDATSATMYSDTSFYPTQLNYGLPNSPDSYVSIKTPISPSAALCTMDSPALMEPSSSLPLPTITPAVSTTIPTSNYFFNETQSSSYSNFFNTADIQQPQQSEQQFLSHHYSHQNEDRDQVQLQHLLQPYYHPRKKTRRLSITSGALSPTQQDNTPFMKTTPHSPRSPPQATPPAPREKKKLPTRSMEEIGSNEPGFSLENESTPSPSSPTGLNRVSQIKDGSAHEENEYEHSNIVQQMATPSTTKTSAEATPLNNGGNSTTEIRRQIHIQSEQKRRAQIKCGFDELRNELPVCLNKKMSKVTLLHRTVQHIQHLKSTQMTILTELERLVQENEQLKRLQQSALQKQVMDSIYPSQ